MEQNNQKLSAVPMRGMRDLLPKEVELRQSVIATIKNVYESYGFLEVETPIVERADLLRTGEGGDNEKQTFNILKRGLSFDDIKDAGGFEDIIDGGLRFDLTVPLARYYANNQGSLPLPFKVLQMGSVFRAERPQKGRYRQFTQCDIDVIGDESNLAERELVLATAEALQRIGFTDFTVRINDRRILRGIAESCGYGEDEFDLVFIIIDKLDKIGLDGVEKELEEKVTTKEASTKLIEILRSVSNGETDLFSLLPSEVDADVVAELKETMESISNQADGKYQVKFDPTLVRGMGYYTGPIFEIEDKDFPSSIAGGGRYDKMIGKFTGTEVPACGFSIGFERIMSILEERNFVPGTTLERKVVLYDPETVDLDQALDFAKKERSQNSIVSLQKRKKNTRNQLEELSAIGYTSFCVLDSESTEPEFKALS